MSDDYEESPYEEDEPRQATAVEVLPPPKKQLSWPVIGLCAFAIFMAGKVGDRAIDRLSGTANAGVPQAMVTDSLPVSKNIDDRRGADEEPQRASRYAYSSFSGRGIRERARAGFDSVMPPEEPDDGGLEETMRQRQVLRDWGPPACPPRYYHEPGDRTWSCWPN